MAQAQAKIRDRKPFASSTSMSVEQCHFISGEHLPVNDSRFKIQSLTKLVFFIVGKNVCEVSHRTDISMLYVSEILFFFFFSKSIGKSITDLVLTLSAREL